MNYTDLITRINNAVLASGLGVRIPYSNKDHKFIHCLEQEGFLSYRIDYNTYSIIIFNLSSKQLKIRSSPARNVFRKRSEIRAINRGMGINIFYSPTTKQILSTQQFLNTKLPTALLLAEVI
jgi:ribosomal protein S8